MMVMTLCLMVYNVVQYDLRTCLEKNNGTVLNQNKKPTKKPTMQRVFRLFQGVHVLTINITNKVQTLVINLTDQLKKIIRYFGPTAERIYQLSG
jgi:transposase